METFTHWKAAPLDTEPTSPNNMTYSITNSGKSNSPTMHCKSNYFTFRDLIDVVDYLEGQDVYFENDVHHIYGRQCSPEELQERVQLILELNRLSDRTRLIEELPPQIVQLVFKCDTIFCLRDRADTIARHYFKTIGKHPFYIWIAEKNEVRSFYGEYFDGSVEKLSFNPESHTF